MINIPDNDQGTTIIRIEGVKDGVAKAKKVCSLSIKRKYVLNLMMTRSICYLSIHENKNSTTLQTDCTMYLISACYTKISIIYEFQCFQELESLVSKMENEREKDLIIESRFHRLLIGNKGENIQKLRDEFAAVQISFPDLGSKSEIVKLRGPKDDVEKCSKIINKNVRELMENNYQVKVPIFKQFHKFIIGKSGASIRQIRSETETKIELPESGSESDMITVTGKKENVDKAVKRIQKIQEEMANVVTAEVTIPAKIHNTMIGSGGKLIQSVMDDCGGVSIKFPPPESKSDKVRWMIEISVPCSIVMNVYLPS